MCRPAGTAERPGGSRVHAAAYMASGLKPRRATSPARTVRRDPCGASLLDGVAAALEAGAEALVERGALLGLRGALLRRLLAGLLLGLHLGLFL